MEKQQNNLVFGPDDYEALTSIVGTYLITNVEKLSEKDCADLRRLRTLAFGRLIAHQERLLDNKGVFYEERKQQFAQSVRDDPEYSPMNDRKLESVESLPANPAEAMTIEVPYTDLLQRCIRWYSENITVHAETVTDMLDTVHPELRDEVIEEVESASMRATGWAYELGLRDIEAMPLS